MSIRLHLLGLPHTITKNEFSHCAFTGKILRFSPMMIARGFEVYHYGVYTTESGATKDINLMSLDEWEQYRIESYKFLFGNNKEEDILKKLKDKTSFIGDLGNWDTPLYKEFNKRLTTELVKNYRSKSTDIVCITFGPAHEDALRNLDVVCVETGIGYDNSYKDFRIFESYSKLFVETHHTELKNYWFVIPNYYNVLEFPLSLNPNKNTIGFFGRISRCKGCSIIVEIAKKFPNIDFILCGQGDPTEYLILPNIKYKEPIHGFERGEYLGSLMALLAPSKYSEPFCGVNVEAQLCGTPVITHPYGALIETVEPFKTGMFCKTLADFCYSIQLVLDNNFDRNYIHKRAVEKYNMYNVGKQYEYAFKTILDLFNKNGGWYSSKSHLSILQES
jgi:glycosyltransferase involved in cell wall biosynthesis